MRRTTQRGIALVTALLVVAVAVLASTALLTSSHMALRRTAAMRDTEQAWMLARGVEAWILEVIESDDNQYDALDADNPWSQPVDFLPVDQGFLSGRVVDQQGLFNLNNLQRPGGGQGGVAQDVHGPQFQRLLEELAKIHELPTPLPDLVPAIRDWMDVGQVPTFPGVEDSAYLSLTPGYRTADRHFESISELRAVNGVTREIYRALARGCSLGESLPPQPCISALPPGSSGQATTVNVNTAPRPVLMALSAKTDESALDAFIGERVQKPAVQKDDFTSLGIYNAADPGERIIEQYDVSTGYLQIRGQVVVGSSRLPLYSLIRRQPRHEVISRSAAED